MSDRLIQIGRVPLITDPYIAIKASRAFSTSRAQTERVIELGRAVSGLLSVIRNGARRFTDLLQRAIQIRNLSTMTDKSLSDIGIRRDQLSQFYTGNGPDTVVRQRHPVWPGDSER